MTRFILLTLFSLFITSAVSGQGKKGERIKAMKVAFITDKLELTPKESQDFWPLYNELYAQLREIRKGHKMDRLDGDLSEADAMTLINKKFEADQKELDLKKDYALKMKEVISPIKLIRLEAAEKQFKRELLHRAKGNRQR